MKPYHKINTIYKRDLETHQLIEGDYSCEEFELLKDIEWVGTEKIDGTNIRVNWHGEDEVVLFKGRTDRAVIPKHLEAHLVAAFPPWLMHNVFGNKSVCLYGEGYGVKIQQGGNYTPNGVGFILFDILVGDWWLKREDVAETALSLSIPVVPIITSGRLEDAKRVVRQGFRSRIAHNREYMAEGLILKPRLELFARNGTRIITKLKHKDFKLC